jgi:hypothetical protein
MRTPLERFSKALLDDVFFIPDNAEAEDFNKPATLAYLYASTYKLSTALSG